MATAVLIEDNGNERKYLINSGDHIILRLEDDDIITFWDVSDNKFDGEFSFLESEIGNRYLLARMFVPRNLIGSGLGRAAIEFFIDAKWDAVIFARDNDGIVREDGSNLTDDAPFFVGKMIAEGLLEETITED